MKTVRQMLGQYPDMDEDMQFNRQSLIDNVSLLKPEILGEVNVLVVATGQGVALKSLAHP